MATSVAHGVSRVVPRAPEALSRARRRRLEQSNARRTQGLRTRDVWLGLRRQGAVVSSTRLILVLSASALVAACAVSVVDEPVPTPDEPSPTEPSTPAPAPEASEVPSHERCARPPAAVEVELPDGGTAVVYLFEECREVPERDLGDPPPV
jgi:hypothetical protein